ncbi:uncharacterized protein LOC101454414 [Ceratitis capitata]|uniref:uncharacterized protein LOC101454414 n=1 Tax=Ceratitis capitata TaxID=7213 RepID=UPI000A11ACAF|nr:uncharacterized protein LOC101454414 [Ceratitis capitata]
MLYHQLHSNNEMEKFMTGRPQRNRRHSRRAWPPEDDLHQPRLVKRLFTPDIKRMLKDWLVRRRENPYPSREEKKRLAIETGLTYTQICNWFANWRRKLKNSERERNQRSWGHLIKHYNTNARGNVEQFSISSEDSIWEEEEFQRDNDDDDDEFKRSDVDEYDESREDGISSGTEGTGSSSRGYCYNNFKQIQPALLKQELCDLRHTKAPSTCRAIGVACPNNARLYSEATTAQQVTNSLPQVLEKPNLIVQTAKYKQKMMEKYLRDTNEAKSVIHTLNAELNAKQIDIGAAGVGDAVSNVGNTALSKWLESAARFTPDKNNYFIEWNGRTGKLERKQCIKQLRRVTIIPANSNNLQHQNTNSCPTQLELDAAEALANMAFNCRQRVMDCNQTNGSLQRINAIGS